MSTFSSFASAFSSSVSAFSSSVSVHSSLPENHEVSSPSSAHFRKYTSFNLYICKKKTSFYPKASAMIKWEWERRGLEENTLYAFAKLKAPLFSVERKLEWNSIFLSLPLTHHSHKFHFNWILQTNMKSGTSQWNVYAVGNKFEKIVFLPCTLTFLWLSQ